MMRRRHFLQYGLAATALPTISFQSRADLAENWDVIVIGAGSAGLYAARHLLNQGYRVLILEASQRHGGRVFSQTLGETRLDMGAEEHYTQKNNPVYDAVVEKFGSESYVRFYVGDTLLSMDGGNTCWENTGSCYQDTDIKNYWDYWKHYGNRGQHTDFSISTAEDILAHYGVKKGHRAYHLYDGGFAGSIYGTSLDKLGAASLAQQDWIWTLSNDIRGLGNKRLGYLDVLNEIWWNPILPHVRLNTPVTRVSALGPGVIVTDAYEKNYKAQKTIVTASIGVLQSEAIQFTPVLPEATINAYRNIGMGKGMKIALRFSKPFWDTKLTYFVHEGLTSCGWIPTSYKVDATDHIIMCYPMGDNALTLAKRTAGDGESMIKIALSELDLVFSGKPSRTYVDGIVQDWTATRYVEGTYSYPMPNTYDSHGNSMRQQLAKPVLDKIFFAGEGTNHHNPSTVPGAIQEGIRAAKAVDTLLQGSSSSQNI